VTSPRWRRGCGNSGWKQAAPLRPAPGANVEEETRADELADAHERPSPATRRPCVSGTPPIAKLYSLETIRTSRMKDAEPREEQARRREEARGRSKTGAVTLATPARRSGRARQAMRAGRSGPAGRTRLAVIRGREPPPPRPRSVGRRGYDHAAALMEPKPAASAGRCEHVTRM